MLSQILTSNHSYPFGMLMPGRSNVTGNQYRFGFNGKENDNDVKGEGNQQDYGMRIYNSRLGRFLSVDPITAKFPMLTPYQFASNSPLQGIDIEGLELYITTSGELLGSFGNSTKLRIVTDPTVQSQIKLDVKTPKRYSSADYESYHTSLKTLNEASNMITKAEMSSKAEGFASVVNADKSVASGSTGTATLTLESGIYYMNTPENLPPIPSASDNQDITILHSHALYPFSFEKKGFKLLPYNKDITSKVGTSAPYNLVYNMDAVFPSPSDLTNSNNSKGYNWILIGHITPITFNPTTNKLSSGVTGAVFYKGNINTDYFRLNKSQLNTLYENAQQAVTDKIAANILNRPR